MVRVFCFIAADLLVSRDSKYFSWPWLPPLQVWGKLTMIFTGKFVYIAHHFIFLKLSSFGLRVDRQERQFELSML